jgi:hypothetical protein
MNKKELDVINSLLGEDFLQKTEVAGIFKQNTNSVIPLEEIHMALQIVPRSVLAYLYHNLIPLKVGDNWDTQLPFANASIHVNKLSSDNYSGEIIKDAKVLARFSYRSLPGVGLVLLSALELYDINQLDELRNKVQNSEPISKLQDMIDERVKMHTLISNVVEQKIATHEAIKEMINYKINQDLFMKQKEEISESQEKKSKLREFLENRQARQMQKNEIHCPDCGSALHKGGDLIKLCICYGEFMDKEVKINKNEDGSVKLKFPKNFDSENIAMLLEVLKRK